MTNLVFHNNGSNMTTLTPQNVKNDIELKLPAKSGTLISLDDDKPRYVTGYRQNVNLANENENALTLTVGPGGRFEYINQAIIYLDSISPQNYYNNAIIEIMDGYVHQGFVNINKSEFRITIRPHDRTHLSNNTALEVVVDEDWLSLFTLDNRFLFYITSPATIYFNNIHFKINTNTFVNKKFKVGFMKSNLNAIVTILYCVFDGFNGIIISNVKITIQHSTFKNINSPDLSLKQHVLNGQHIYCYNCTFENINQYCITHCDFDYYFNLTTCTFKNCTFIYLFYNHNSGVVEICGSNQIDNLRYNALALTAKNTHPTLNGYVRDLSTNDFPSRMP
ncbi:hypothetical protein ACVWU4_000973 [Campylobacter coli]